MTCPNHVDFENATVEEMAGFMMSIARRRFPLTGTDIPPDEVFEELEEEVRDLLEEKLEQYMDR